METKKPIRKIIGFSCGDYYSKGNCKRLLKVYSGAIAVYTIAIQLIPDHS